MDFSIGVSAKEMKALEIDGDQFICPLCRSMLTCYSKQEKNDICRRIFAIFERFYANQKCNDAFIEKHLYYHLFIH